VSAPPFSLIAATEADYTWLWELKRLTMRPYVERTWGLWDEKLQSDFFRKNFHGETVQLIMLGGMRAGLLEVQHERDGIFLANIQIHPEFQNQGLGSAVIVSVQESAKNLGSSIRLQVLKVNVDAQELYARLGFYRYGETLTHVLLRWAPGR
jgi:ribosomal protein S18 acetylase RimI-like enzyme